MSASNEWRKQWIAFISGLTGVSELQQRKAYFAPSTASKAIDCPLTDNSNINCSPAATKKKKNNAMWANTMSRQVIWRVSVLSTTTSSRISVIYKWWSTDIADEGAECQGCISVYLSVCVSWCVASCCHTKPELLSRNENICTGNVVWFHRDTFKYNYCYCNCCFRCCPHMLAALFDHRLAGNTSEVRDASKLQITHYYK